MAANTELSDSVLISIRKSCVLGAIYMLTDSSMGLVISMQ